MSNIERYRNIDELLIKFFNYKKLICSNQIQQLMELLPENDNKKLLQIEIKYKFLNKFDAKKFLTIYKNKINSVYENLYNVIEFKIKYSENKIIDKELFNNDLAKIMISFDNFFQKININSEELLQIPKSCLVDELITLNLTNNNLENIPFLIGYAR